MKNKTIQLNHVELTQKVNLETGRISWQELQRFFARGRVIVVSPGSDLVEIAVQIAENQSAIVEQLIQSQQIHHATDDDAKRWNEQQSEFWATVVAPWVLIQETVSDTSN